MEILYQSCCGLDVHKKMIVACLRRTDEGGKVGKQVRKGATRKLTMRVVTVDTAGQKFVSRATAKAKRR